MTAESHAPKTRIVILGGGFGGVYTARHLEKLCKGRKEVEIVLVSRDNYLLMTPLLFEVCSGTLDVRHCSFPIRAFLRTTRFAEATVQGSDLERRVVHLTTPAEAGELAYDQLVLALGAMTNRVMIPGSEHSFTFKNLADALLLRNHLIERFERADVETDPERKHRLLTFVIIGGGLVGVELFGELTSLVDGITPPYKHVSRDEVRFILLQGADRVMPEINPKLAAYGARVLGKRRGADIRTNTLVRAIEVVRRTYYLLQMPDWGRRLRIMIDWAFAVLFRPDIVKISLDSEAALLLREASAGAVGVSKRTEGASGPGAPPLARTPDGKPGLNQPGQLRPSNSTR
ncbi:MAG TPA: FAD-dependent oxidoreductase [Gemmataceae bacterium]|jgi:NADH dehydrogenase FAD-containing subunit|nr:FAD-dependent oxidoreductase [Gemmataceae bacterium]